MEQTPPPILEYSNHPRVVKPWKIIALTVCAVITLISVAGAVVMIWLLVNALTWRGAENQAEMGLFVVGLPFIILEVGIFLPTILAFSSVASKRRMHRRSLILAGCTSGIATLIVVTSWITFWIRGH
jgi:threonine/homoserine/homoserine lactone efflux protein